MQTNDPTRKISQNYFMSQERLPKNIKIILEEFRSDFVGPLPVGTMAILLVAMCCCFTCTVVKPVFFEASFDTATFSIINCIQFLSDEEQNSAIFRQTMPNRLLARIILPTKASKFFEAKVHTIKWKQCGSLTPSHAPHMVELGAFSADF